MTKLLKMTIAVGDDGEEDIIEREYDNMQVTPSQFGDCFTVFINNYQEDARGNVIAVQHEGFSNILHFSSHEIYDTDQEATNVH